MAHLDVSAKVPPTPVYGYRWYLRSKLPERRWQPCRIVHRDAQHLGPAALVMIEFQDGFLVEATRHAIKAARLRVAIRGGMTSDHPYALRRADWVCPGCIRTGDAHLAIGKLLRDACIRRTCGRCGKRVKAAEAQYVRPKPA